MKFKSFKDPEYQYRENDHESLLQKVHGERGDLYYQHYKDPKHAQNPLSNAINEYVQASENDDDAYTLAQLARMYLLNGKFEMAEKYINKVLQRELKDKNALKNALETLACMQFYKGDRESTIKLLKQSMAYEKPWRRGNFHFAIVTFQLYFNFTKPSLKGWLSTLWHTLWGSLLSVSYLFNPSVKPYVVLFILMSIKGFRSQNRVLNDYLELYKTYPGLELIHTEIGKIYAQREQYAEAEYWFKEALQRHPIRDDGYQYLTNLYQITGNLEQLIEILESWLLIRPNNGEIMSVLSQALSQVPEHYERALELAKRAILNLQSPVMLANAYTHLGNLYSCMQSYDAAVTAYQAGISIYPQGLDTYVYLGTLYYDKQEYLLSQKVFEKALSLSGSNAKIFCNLGYLAWMQGNIQQSLDYYHQSITLDPTYDIALNNLGVLYLDHVGNIQKAMELFDQTLIYNPNYALCHYNKGRAFSFLGKTIEAARCFSLAQDLNEVNQELDNRELTDRINQLFENSEQIQNTDM